jgi:chromate transporter
MIEAELFARFLLISVIAFGGGQAALPLVERVAVQDAGWITSAAFGSAVAFGYLTPGPVLITATFVGQQVAGLSGAFAATVGVFLVPWVLAAAAAQQVRRLAQDQRLRAFGAGATPAAIGILGVTVLGVSREAFVSWPYFALGAAVFALAAWRRTPPVALLGIGGGLGWVLGLV